MRELVLLLVEDEEPKQRHISEFLSHHKPPVRTLVARSVTRALDLIEHEPLDLMLLDMSLPTFDIAQGESGGRPQGFGGLEIVRNLEMSGQTCPTLIVTGYEAFPTDSGEQVQLAVLESELQQILGTNFLGVLHFNSAVDEWKTELSDRLQRIWDTRAHEDINRR